MKKNKKFVCEICGRSDFLSQRGVYQHDRIAHPYIPPPPPKRTTEIASLEEESHNLLSGKRLNIGDVVWLGRKAVITKIIRTENSNDVEVILRMTKKWWSSEPIS
jgi:hypothetical protein